MLTFGSYFDNIARIASPDYMPNDQDVLRSRVKTTGITETTFIIGELTYRMFDVGGQRSERKKWIHCFENVTTILFLVAISEYDQLLFEDETVNRMQEALTLFDSICNSRWFIKTSIILFLNKIDRFKEKLPVSPMKNYFPDYEGGDDYGAACDYILNRFVSLNQHESKQIYTHFTCATDTTQIRFVMAAVNGKLGRHSSRSIAVCANEETRHHHPGEPPPLRSHLSGSSRQVGRCHAASRTKTLRHLLLIPSPTTIPRSRAPFGNWRNHDPFARSMHPGPVHYPSLSTTPGRITMENNRIGICASDLLRDMN